MKDEEIITEFHADLTICATKEQADILKDVPENQLEFNAKLTLYDTLRGNNNVIWVIPSGQPISLNR